MLFKYSTSEIQAAYQTLIAKITDNLEKKDFRKLRRACYLEIQAPDSTLPKSLVKELKLAESLDDMLDVLALTPYCNWSDIRLLQAIVCASGSREAKKLLENFKAKFYNEEVFSDVNIKSLN